MSDAKSSENAATPAESENDIKLAQPPQQPTSSSNATTPASSITGGPTSSRLKAPTNFGGSTGTVSKIGRLCTHATPKTGPPPRDTNSMSRESDDNLSSINSTYTDMYQETVKRFTRSSLSPEMDRYSPSRISTKSGSTSLRSEPDRRTSYHGSVLTVDTEQFIIGQKVWVSGIRPGQIAYIGETHFAPGDWAGVVLDEPNGKNDGCVSGKRYFQCEPKRGIFSRLTRLTMVPLPGATTPTSPISKFSPERSRTVSPTASIRSSFMRSPGGKNGLTVGDRIIVSSGFGSRPGILRYLGETQFASGNWCGVELDEASGKNDGSVDGIKYFDCKPKYGVFVPIAKVSLSPSSKKTRLSRAGSRESLTSIGTMNSIATTNTSRMRMNAQRKSTSIKPVTSPKNLFSMQDLLREKQNHIEQLMIERDLDREDSQNQALQLQKNISELKTRITHLERKLDDERKKSEDLQFSVDEATFCGDELNAQTQVYKEKIHDLELKITQLASGTPSLQTPSIQEDNSAALAAATEAANTQIDELQAKLQEQAQLYEARFAEVQDEEKRLQENVKYLQTETETLQKELLDKDESLEKFSLSESGIDNLRRELALLKEENEKERQKTNATYTQELEVKSVEIKRLTEELAALKGTFGTLEGERTNMEDECEILRAECKIRDDQVQDVNQQIAKLSAELSMQKAESATLDELLRAQQLGSVEGKAALDDKITQIAKMKTEITDLQSAKAQLEANLQTAGTELKKLAEVQRKVEENLSAAHSADEEKRAAMKKFEVVMEELKIQVSETSSKNEALNEELKGLRDAELRLKGTEEILRKELKEKEQLHVASVAELETVSESVLKLQHDLSSLQENSGQAVSAKTKEIESLSSEITKLQEKIKTLEGESASTVQQMSSKIHELEGQIEKFKQSLKVREEELESSKQERAKQEAIIAENIKELKSTTATLESTSGLLEKLKQEHELSLTKHHELEDHAKKTEENCAQHQLELGDLTRKLTAMTTKCDNLAAQNETLQQDILAARTSGSEVQAGVRKLNEELAPKQKELTDLQADRNAERLKFESQIEELNQKSTNAAKDFGELKLTLNKTKDELAKKNEHITALEEKTIKQELSISDLLRQQENLQTKYDSLVAQNSALQNDLTALRTSSTDSSADLLKLSQDITVKQKAFEDLLDKTNGERATLEGQLQASQQRVDALCSQVEALTQELKGTTEESFKRFEVLKQEQEKSGKQELELGDLTRKLETLSTKCQSLESQNDSLQKDLSSLRTASTGSNAEVLKLTEELSSKQKTLQNVTDKSSAERLQLENQLQELTQRLQTSQNETESLRGELKSTAEAKSLQASEFESLKAELHSSASTELEEVKAKESDERKKLMDSFEAQMKKAEQTKITLDDAISNLQTQIRLLQDELMKSQLDFRTKEEDLTKQVEVFVAEKEILKTTLQQVQTEGTSTLSSVQQEKADLLQSIQRLTQELNEKDQKLQNATSDAEQLKILQSNASTDLTQLEAQVKTLQNALELSTAEAVHRTKLSEEDQKRVAELQSMLEAVQASNARISETNAAMAETLQILEQEKCETANIFELFEMESDQNLEQLLSKVASTKQELSDAKALLVTKDSALAESQKTLEKVTAELESGRSTVEVLQSNVLEYTTKLSELSQASEELQTANAAQQTQIQQSVELATQLNEYKKIVDEMDDDSTEKSSKMSQLQARIKQLEKEKEVATEGQNTLKIECTRLQRKLEDVEQTSAMQGRLNDLQSSSKRIENGSGDGLNSGDGDSTAQINFLNSIIADMQRKNDTLKSKIEALEALPMDFTKPKAFELLSKRKPAPRVFCDICDEFDKHETEDCPLQASDERDLSPTPGAETNNNDPANKKERKLPEPRKYCESCEVFGHETGACDDECF